ncbi:MAG: hypothetical protein ABIQ02_03310 [Saprospiraceae bacterium]
MACFSIFQITQMPVNDFSFVSHIGARANMDLVIEIWKKTGPQCGACFPTFQQPKRIGLLINGKTPGYKSGACFTIYQQPDDDKIFIYEMN